jgi:hypothetical protein
MHSEVTRQRARPGPPVAESASCSRHGKALLLCTETPCSGEREAEVTPIWQAWLGLSWLLRNREMQERISERNAERLTSSFYQGEGPSDRQPELYNRLSVCF